MHCEGGGRQLSGLSHGAENSLPAEGGPSVEAQDSKHVHEVVRKMIKDFLVESPGQCTVGNLGGLVSDALSVMESNSGCRPRSTAGSRHIFPLPVKSHRKGG